MASDSVCSDKCSRGTRATAKGLTAHRVARVITYSQFALLPVGWHTCIHFSVSLSCKRGVRQLTQPSPSQACVQGPNQIRPPLYIYVNYESERLRCCNTRCRSCAVPVLKGAGSGFFNYPTSKRNTQVEVVTSTKQVYLTRYVDLGTRVGVQNDGQCVLRSSAQMIKRRSSSRRTEPWRSGHARIPFEIGGSLLGELRGAEWNSRSFVRNGPPSVPMAHGACTTKDSVPR